MHWSHMHTPSSFPIYAYFLELHPIRNTYSIEPHTPGRRINNNSKNAVTATRMSCDPIAQRSAPQTTHNPKQRNTQTAKCPTSDEVPEQTPECQSVLRITGNELFKKMSEQHHLLLLLLVFLLLSLLLNRFLIGFK